MPAGNDPLQPASGDQALHGDDEWHRDLVNRLAFASLNEQRRARRWNVFFKVLLALYLGAILLLYWPGEWPDTAGSGEKHTALVELKGIISDEASGGYYVATAADEIYVDKASIVGSIGVRMDSFGFVGTMDKLGVERRLYTAGESKAFLDPFLPSKASDVAHIETLLVDIHEQFINAVKDGRGDRLKESEDMFSGLIWTGEESLAMGMADGLGSSSYVAREIIEAEEIVEFTAEPDLLERLTDRLGIATAQALGKILATGSTTIR
jgi:protease-4